MKRPSKIIWLDLPVRGVDLCFLIQSTVSMGITWLSNLTIGVATSNSIAEMLFTSLTFAK